MVGHTATVSTLVTVVGHPYRPTLAGNGGFRRGLPAQWAPMLEDVRAGSPMCKLPSCRQGLQLWGFLSSVSCRQHTFLSLLAKIKCCILQAQLCPGPEVGHSSRPLMTLMHAADGTHAGHR
eukprot:1152009-Pelagomonas_calceolata.AAC.2